MFFGKKELENKVVLLEAEINKLKVELEQKNKDLDNLAKKHSVELEPTFPLTHNDDGGSTPMNL